MSDELDPACAGPVCNQPLCPLNRVRAGTAVRVKELCASPELACRLREIGLGEEQIVKLLANHSNIICKVCNARLAISSPLAETIMVEPLDAASAV
jgi:Fe2+ transport system protein FeoA